MLKLVKHILEKFSVWKLNNLLLHVETKTRITFETVAVVDFTLAIVAWESQHITFETVAVSLRFKSLYSHKFSAGILNILF